MTKTIKVGINSNMTVKSYIEAFEDTHVLKAFRLNNPNRNVAMYNQSIGGAVSPNQLVYYSVASTAWIPSVDATPIGYYYDDNIVILSGFVDEQSGLEPGKVYYMKSDTTLTGTAADSFNNTKVGVAISNTSFLVDIDTIGPSEPQKKT